MGFKTDVFILEGATDRKHASRMVLRHFLRVDL